MPKWTPDDHGCIYDEAGCFARLTPNKAERLASRHNADIDALTAERDSAIDEKLFWVDKYAHEMERADRRCDQWQRCFRLAFELKSRYFNQLRVMTAERDEIQRRLDEVVVGEPETDITKAVHGRLYMVMFPYLFGGIPESMYFGRDNDGKYFWGKYPPAQGGPLWGSHNTVAWFAEIRAIAEGRTE